MTDIADSVVARNQLCNANELQIPLCLRLPLFIYLFFPSASPAQLCPAFLTEGTALFNSSKDK